MFYFLISACQTVSIVNGHQEREREREGGGGTERNKGAMESEKKETRKAFACFCGIMVSQTKITHYIHLSTKARCAGSLPPVLCPSVPSLVSFMIASFNFDLCDSSHWSLDWLAILTGLFYALFTVSNFAQFSKYTVLCPLFIISSISAVYTKMFILTPKTSPPLSFYHFEFLWCTENKIGLDFDLLYLSLEKRKCKVKWLN